MPAAPWSRPRGLEAVLGKWHEEGSIARNLVVEAPFEARGARVAAMPEGLHPNLRAMLERRGIHELYTHQVEAFEAARSGKHVVVATPTASGKSLCFHLPVLQSLAEDPDARAMYLYPTKALSRDQEAGLRAMLQEANLAGRGAGSAIVYDGDTPGDARRVAREKAGILLTNPDMLHAGILPHHTNWARTFQHLKTIVVDELHTYKGLFGGHVSHVLQRLLRVARFHGSNPTVIMATATIGNPREHAARMIGVSAEEVRLVDRSGAPSGGRRVVLYNPPVVNAELGIRASYVKQAVKLAADLVRAEVPTIVFGQSRNNVEVMLRYLRERVAEHVDPSRLMGYRGGYLPEERRAIEKRLREGEILCVVATSALELGIDIGELQAVVCAGYPGSVAALWQRFGRAGRRSQEALCVLVSSSAPLDQYLCREPEFFLGRPVEEARIDPANVEILLQHLKCAAFELPFAAGEPYAVLGSEETLEALRFLAKNSMLHESSGRFHWAADAYPANHVSLRTAGWDNVVIIDVEHDKTIAELDWQAAHTMLHEQAIYQHDGGTWQVERFDYENHKAYVRAVEPDYFTDAMTYVRVAVFEKESEAAVVEVSEDRWNSGWGEVSVTEKVVGYKKVKFNTHENAGYGEVRLPEIELHTTAFWLVLPSALARALPYGRAAVIDGLRGISIALETVSTLALMCDPRDLATTLGEAAPDGTLGTGSGGVEYDPTLFLYEHVPGGTGLSERIFEQRDELLARARTLISGCPCSYGCPACVGPGDAMVQVDGVDVGRKQIALDLLRRVHALA
jgi:DEAD/DEAH box helicase domain-containing protein